MWEWIKSLWSWIQFDNKQIADLQVRVCSLEEWRKSVEKREHEAAQDIQGAASRMKKAVEDAGKVINP